MKRNIIISRQLNGLKKQGDKKLRWVTSPIAYSGKTFNDETKLELLLQKKIKQGNPLQAIAEERVCLESQRQQNIVL